MYDPREIAEDPAFRESFENKPLHQKHISYMWGVHDLNWEEWSLIIARYFGYITLIDDYIGLLLDFLKEEGLYDNTTIVFTADHGDAMGAHRLIEKGEFMYDETYRIPMIVKSPLIREPGSGNDDFVYLHDLFPTALELAGEDLPELDQARSLVPILKGESSRAPREFVYGQFTRTLYRLQSENDTDKRAQAGLQCPGEGRTLPPDGGPLRNDKSYPSPRL